MNFTYFHAGIGEQKLEHSTFDRVLLVTVLGEIPHKQAALEEIFNALKPGGILSITEIIFDPHFQRKSTVTHLTRSVGFREYKTFGSWWGFYYQPQKTYLDPVLCAHYWL